MNSVELKHLPLGLTVRDLKALIADWPEEAEDGSLTEVWIAQAGSTSSQAGAVWPLNQRQTEEGRVYADLLLDTRDARSEKQTPSPSDDVNKHLQLLTTGHAGDHASIAVDGGLGRDWFDRLREIYKDVDPTTLVTNHKVQLVFPAAGGKPVAVNPFEHFAEEHVFLMGLAQDMAGVRLTDEQRELATHLGLEACASDGGPSVRALVDVWRAEPALAGFANALLASALPGGLE